MKCSELCHASFTLLLAVKAKESQAASFDFLKQAEEYLEGASTSLIGWSRSHEPWFADLEERYVAGEVDDQAVEVKLKETGVWGVSLRRMGPRLSLST